jgi:hypothetical protein
LLGWAILERESVVTIRGILLMINVLGFGLYRLLAQAYCGRGSPFLSRFVVVGFIATLVYFDCCQLLYDPVLRTQKWALAPIGVDACHIHFIDVPSLGMIGRITPQAVMISVALAPVVVTLVGLPQALVALVGGLLWRRVQSRRWDLVTRSCELSIRVAGFKGREDHAIASRAVHGPDHDGGRVDQCADRKLVSPGHADRG